MLLVIMGHLAPNCSFAYGVHLVLFFVLSGYLTQKKEITLDFIHKKFKQLMVPYFYTCIAVTLTDMLQCIVLRGGGQLE